MLCCCTVCIFFVICNCYSREMMHLHIIICDMIVFDIDIVSNAFLDMPIWSWYIHIYMYYILPKLYVNMHRFFNTSEHLPSIYIYAQKEWNNHLHSLLLLLDISRLCTFDGWVHISTELYSTSTVCHMQKLLKYIRKQRN